MWIIDAIVNRSVRHRGWVLFFTGLLVLGAAWIASNIRFDAFPDLTNTQVQVLTTSPGMAAEEVELLVTLPLERALGGVADVDEVRSLSRDGVSAITVVFKDGTDLWRARQAVKEQVDVASGELPPSAGTPGLGPPSTGLGEVVQFTLRSDDQSPSALYRVFERDVAPRLRMVDGVVEVNAWGGGAPQLDVVVDPWRLSARGLAPSDVEDALARHVGITPGGAVESDADRAPVRAVANPTSSEALGRVVVRHDADGPVHINDVAEVVEGASLTTGLGTANGEGEALFVVVQLLAGADARAVVADVRAELDRITPTLPEDVEVDVIYDREKLVGHTLTTVAESLIAGGLLVVLVLLLLLGDLRAGLVVASVIPLSMLGAFAGLSLLGVSGNLMSLGAVDFGLVVDGTIVVVESIVAVDVARRGALGQAIAERARAVARPVFFGFGLLLLVYLPILGMQGTEGKLFRPMALTVLLALMTALALTFTYVPALASLVVRPKAHHRTWLQRLLDRVYEPLVGLFVPRPWLAAGAAVGLLAIGGITAAFLGFEFVPRLEEGDLVVQTGRLPSVPVDVAREEALRVERVLRQFPEVEQVASRIGSPAVATDPMGLEEGDVLVRLKERSEWETADTTAGLADAFADALSQHAPGSALTMTQPIEMRFNELLEGVPSDVGVHVHGHDLAELERVSEDVAAVLSGIEGAADVKVPVLEGLPALDVVVDEAAAARLGVSAADVHLLVAGLQRGTAVTKVLRGAFQDDVVIKTRRPDHVALADLPLALPDGGTITLGDVARVEEVVRPAVIRRADGSRRLTVQANVRGRDVGSFVAEAKQAMEDRELPAGLWLSWAGKAEQLAEAAFRTAIVLPVVLVLIILLLIQALGHWRPAGLLFLAVPAAVTGGLVALALRGLPLSMSAIVGFIALAGVAVMNGLVLVSRTLEVHRDEPDSRKAAQAAAKERFRPVLMTALVAGLGFLPMALNTGVGAEVQRPLATVVIGGLISATPVTLLVLPALYGWWIKRQPQDQDVAEELTPETSPSASPPGPPSAPSPGTA